MNPAGLALLASPILFAIAAWTLDAWLTRRARAERRQKAFPVLPTTPASKQDGRASKQEGRSPTASSEASASTSTKTKPEGRRLQFKGDGSI